MNVKVLLKKISFFLFFYVFVKRWKVRITLSYDPLTWFVRYFDYITLYKKGGIIYTFLYFFFFFTIISDISRSATITAFHIFLVWLVWFDLIYVRSFIWLVGLFLFGWFSLFPFFVWIFFIFFSFLFLLFSSFKKTFFFFSLNVKLNFLRKTKNWRQIERRKRKKIFQFWIDIFHFIF